jgi:Fe-S oxidoreductase
VAVALATGWSAGSLAAVAAAAAAAPEEPTSTFSTVRPDGDALACLNCGLCLGSCPAVRALAREKEAYPGPRGMMAGLARWETELAGVADELTRCTLCGACSAICTASVPVPEAMIRARRLMARSAPEAGPEAYRALRSAFARPGRLFDADPIEGPRLEKAENVLFIGCSLPYYERDHAAATLQLLAALGVELTLIDEVCCGGPLEVIGGEGADELARHNVAELRRVGARRVITCCPRCAVTMAESSAYRGFEIEHTTTTLARLLPGSEVARALQQKLAGRVVTFHDPCERARLAGEVEHARLAMAAVGLELRELPRSGTFTECCGAGGGVRAAHTKASLRMARLRVSDAVGTGAPVLLTECPSCLHNLYNGRKRNQKIAISNLSSFLGAELKG